MSRPESVSSMTQSARLEERHLQDLVPLLLAAGEAGVERAAEHFLSHLKLFGDLAHLPHEVGRRQLAEAARLPLRVERGLEERHRRHARDLDRVLEGEEDAGGGAFVRRQREQVLAR